MDWFNNQNNNDQNNKDNNGNNANNNGFNQNNQYYGQKKDNNYLYNQGSNFYYGQSGNNNNNFNSDGGQPPHKNKKGIKMFFAILGAVILIAGIIIAIAFFGGDSADKSNTATTSKSGDASLTINKTPSSDENSETSSTGILSSTGVYKKCADSVIAILTYQSGSLYGEGSGIIMGEDSSGAYTYIITCAHIIDTSGVSVRIQTADGKQYDADIVGYDTRTDVGVIKVKKTGFTAAEFGDSTKLNVGDTVYALGNPGGTEFYGSFTKGMVSAIDRPTSSADSGYSMECIQHDAAINPGNSGGALINEYGQVIGINSSKIADTDYEGMGFAIPISVAKDVVDKIIANGYVPNRAKLGISYTSVSNSETYSMLVQMKGLPTGSIIIASIDSDGSLAGTDAKVGDLITAVNGKELTTSSVLLDEIEGSSVGDKLTLTICHVSKDYSINQFNVTVKLVEDKGTSTEATTESTTSEFPF